MYNFAQKLVNSLCNITKELKSGRWCIVMVERVWGVWGVWGEIKKIYILTITMQDYQKVISN
ncbi:MAG: hypothetical protein QNJ74_24660 [Trichodesmium sp. MO_231.B1]|nr:hypothetical protein [Trichodesmium sp. MO_231.B1]